jgi:hypothetical protein
MSGKGTYDRELRQAQAVILPLEYGFSMEQVSAVLGVSRGWACQLRMKFIRSGGVDFGKKRQRGGRRRENMSKEEEAAFLSPFGGNSRQTRGIQRRMSQHKRSGEKIPGAPRVNGEPMGGDGALRVMFQDEARFTVKMFDHMRHRSTFTLVRTTAPPKDSTNCMPNCSNLMAPRVPSSPLKQLGRRYNIAQFSCPGVTKSPVMNI